MADTGQRISQYPEATELNGTDCFFEETATPKNFKVSWSTICNAIKSKLASWEFTLKTKSQTLPGAVDELKESVDTQKNDLTALAGKLDGEIRYKYITLQYVSAASMQGYAIFGKGAVLTAVATVENASGTPVGSTNFVCVDVGYGGNVSRVEVHARGTYVEGQVLAANVIAIVKDK